ncbi:MAG: hypothetical protein R3C27_13225 [Hyphomonadaceae bacterium]
MLRATILASSFLVASIMPASAQPVPVRTEAARMLAAVCVTAPTMVDRPNASAMRQCAGEFTVRDGDERLLVLFTRVFAHYPDRAAAGAELQRMIDNEGYTRADYLEVGQMLNRSVALVDAECGNATNPAPEAQTSEQ